MGLKRRYKLVFTRETVTDEGYVIKEKPPVMGQFYETEEMFRMLLVPELVVDQTILQKLYEGIKAQLENPNNKLKNKKEEIKIEEPGIQTITPLYPTNK